MTRDTRFAEEQLPECNEDGCTAGGVIEYRNEWYCTDHPQRELNALTGI